MLRRPKRRFINAPEEDPMTGSANLVDAMLVLSVGFLIFIVLSWNMQNVIFSDMTPQERQDTLQAMKQVAEIKMGKEVNETPQTSSGSGTGFTEMGTVYKDPKTGKLIMIQN
ncbi:DUF2149 domain-containing protein [Methanobacterium sp. ACI-7]|uniref:DUF2149 domain-containing protein n=1 Tax=unclassified Methanobacterium TaxID=2627676 RepID=UPI0039C347E1